MILQLCLEYGQMGYGVSKSWIQHLISFQKILPYFFSLQYNSIEKKVIKIKVSKRQMVVILQIMFSTELFFGKIKPELCWLKLTLKTQIMGISSKVHVF